MTTDITSDVQRLLHLLKNEVGALEESAWNEGINAIRDTIQRGGHLRARINKLPTEIKGSLLKGLMDALDDAQAAVPGTPSTSQTRSADRHDEPDPTPADLLSSATDTSVVANAEAVDSRRLDPAAVRGAADNKTLVTIFGAGVAGLSAAHELIERGFVVQVVEPRESDSVPGAVKVGGLAASQLAAFKATALIHHDLIDPRRDPRYQPTDDIPDEDEQASVMGTSAGDDARRPGLSPNAPADWYRWDRKPTGGRALPAGWTPVLERTVKQGVSEHRALLSQLRALPMQSAHRRFPVNHPLRFAAGDAFEVPAPGDVQPDAVLLLIVRQTVMNFERGYRVLVDELAKLARSSTAKSKTDDVGPKLPTIDNLDPEFLTREVLLLDIFGTYEDGARTRQIARAWNRALTVKLRLNVLLDFLFTIISKLYPAAEQASDGMREHFRDVRDYQRLQSADLLLLFLPVWRALHLVNPDGTPRSTADHFIISARNARSLPRSARLDRDAARSVLVEVVERVLPGEHGYRFFPAWYAHLFDTMRRTPLYDRHGEATYRSVFDSLVPPPPAAIAQEENGFRPAPRKRFESLEELRVQLQLMFADIGGNDRDVLRFQNRIFKFLTSSQARRKRYEGMSWLEFLDGGSEFAPDPKATAESASKYSEIVDAMIRDMPLALNGVSGDHVDARTYGLATVQMLKDFLHLADDKDLQLDGPTSDAWLTPWKTYLKRQGVRFFLGSLDKFEMTPPDTLIPKVSGPLGASTPVPEHPDDEYIAGDAVDFCVLALPYEQITERVWDAWNTKPAGFSFDGDLETLRIFDQRIAERRKDDGSPNRPQQHLVSSTFRYANGEPKMSFAYPMRDFFGIQYYFEKQVRYGRGYIYYPYAPWGLTSIAQMFFWRRRTSLMHGYLGQLSVDVGNAYREDSDQRSAWMSTRGQMAESTWKQMLVAMPAPEIRGSIPYPTFEHVDQGIHFRTVPSIPPNPGNGPVDYNETPFFVQIANQGRLLPDVDHYAGLGQWMDAEHAEAMHGGFVYQDLDEYDDFRSLLYRLSNKHWLLVGNFMPTHTRLSTMESANESGRLAVNTILHTLSSPDATDKYNGGGASQGTFCDVFPPEKRELPDLSWLRNMDRTLMRDELPHFLDILCSMEFIDALPAAPAGPSKSEMIARMFQAGGEAAHHHSGGNQRPELIALRRAEQVARNYLEMVGELLNPKD